MIEEKSELQKQLENLLQKEKLVRMNNDNNESVRILKTVAQICFDAGDLTELIAQVLSLCKKRGQPKKAQIEMVQQCMGYVAQIQNIDTKIQLIEAIKEVSEKKIFLEVEYARCVLQLVKYKESDNNINEASTILQEVQVETYGSMDKREKLEFILYQMRIMIKKLDYTRIIIISKKIEEKNLQDDKILDLKVLYYSYLIFYYKHELDYANAAQCYSKILATLHKNETLQASLPAELEFGFNVTFNSVLENTVLFLTLTPQNENKVGLLRQTRETYQYALEHHPNLTNLISSFLSTELIQTNVNFYNIGGSQIFSPQYEHGQRMLTDFRRQLIQHNLKVFQTYYESIYLERISALIQVDTREIEEVICEMIEAKVFLLIKDKLLSCKIDRVTGVAQFILRKNENQVLDDWSNNINEVLKKVELVSNYIKRDEDQHLTQ